QVAGDNEDGFLAVPVAQDGVGSLAGIADAGDGFVDGEEPVAEALPDLRVVGDGRRLAVAVHHRPRRGEGLLELVAVPPRLSQHEDGPLVGDALVGAYGPGAALEAVDVGERERPHQSLLRPNRPRSARLVRTDRTAPPRAMPRTVL